MKCLSGSTRSRHVVLVLLVVMITISEFCEAFFLQKPAPSTKPSPLIDDLENLIQETDNGVDSSRGDEVKALMTEIAGSRKGDQRDSLPGRWELIYTTEKEINFFRTSWPFAKVSSISQTLDLFGSQLVNNFIDFEGGGQFAVTGSVKPVIGDSDSTYDRVQFEFTAAVATVWGRRISLPPAGAGWFDTMYCDKDYRLSRDSRGDWSVFRRLE